MNILMVHPHDIYSPAEPWTVRITYLAAEFVKMGHRVKLVYHLESPHKDPEIEKKRQEFPFETIPMIRYSSTLLLKIKKIVELGKWADVIHFQKCFSYVSVPCVISGLINGKPVHYDWDDWEAEIFRVSSPEDSFWYSVIHRTERMLPWMVDTISVASKSLWRQATGMGIDHREVFEAPVGGDVEHFDPKNHDSREIFSQYNLKKYVITYMGQLHGAQYCSLFLQMARNLLDVRNDLSFFVIGTGSQFLNLLREAEELKIQEHVIFTGSVSHKKIPVFLKASDICVAAFEDTPQTRTKSPLKICEYMAAGKAIVASRMGEVSDMLDHGNCGILVDPGDSKALAQGVLTLLKDPDLRLRLEFNARKRAMERYNWRASAKNILNAYHLGFGQKKRLFGLSNLVGSDGVFRWFFKPQKQVLFEDLPDVKHALSLEDYRRLAGIKSVTESFIGPKLVQLDVTNLCNNDCVACWSNSPMLEDLLIDPASKRDTIPYEVISRALEELASIGTREIYMAGGGDPTMHPAIFDIWKKIKDLQMVLYVNTNFVRLCSEDKIKRLLDIGIDHFTLSMWAGTPEAYSRTHPNRSEKDFVRLKKAITWMNQMKKTTPYCKVYNVISRLNYCDFHNMLEFALETGCESVEFTLVDTIPGKTDQLLLKEEERLWLHEEASKIWEEAKDQSYKGKVLLFGFERFLRRLSSMDSNLGDHDKNIVESFPCYIAHLFARVMPDGDVNSCLKSHRFPIGNIYHQSFLDIWSSERQKYFRHKAMVYEKKDPFFSLIGNDASAVCGCYKSCDDIARNQETHKKLEELSLAESGFLELYRGWLHLTNQRL